MQREAIKATQMLHFGPPLIPHGTPRRYETNGCHCPPCKEAMRLYRKGDLGYTEPLGKRPAPRAKETDVWPGRP